MTSIERTAYPRFRTLITAAELHNHFTVRRGEAAWAAEKTDSDAHLLALVLSLKCLAKMARFPRLEEIPAQVVDFVRRDLELPGGTVPAWASGRIERNHKALARERVGVRNNQPLARQIAATAVRGEAARKNNPPDLINVAVEKLIEASLELPAFSTLNKMTSRIRAEVNTQIFHAIAGRLTPRERDGLLRLLVVSGPDRKSLFNKLRQPAKSPTWAHLREQVAHLGWVDDLGDTGAWMDGIAASKITDFAGEADAADAAVMGDYEQMKRVALLACLAHKTRQRARDDLAAMFCKRVALKVKAAKTELEEICRRQRALTEGLVTKFKTLLVQIDGDSAVAAMNAAAAELAARTITGLGARAADGDAGPFTFASLSRSSAPEVAALLQAFNLQVSGMERIQATISEAGGFAGIYSDIEAVSAHYGDNYEVLVARFLLKGDRQALFDLAGLLELTATSDDRRVLDALAHARRHRDKTRDYISDRDPDGRPVDLGFASEKWRKAVRDDARPGRLARRHFEACVFVHLAAELRTGDTAVDGAGEYADWNAQLLPWEDCAGKLPGYLAEVGLAGNLEQAQRYDGTVFRGQLLDMLKNTAASADAGYPANEDLQIDPETGVPSLKRHRRGPRRDSAAALEQQIKGRMPERSLLGIVSRTAYWLEWWRRFGPASGSDPKLNDPFGRYVITTFVYGSNMGPYEAARHMRGVSPHELFTAATRHASLDKLNEAITDVVNGHARLDLVQAWGNGTIAAADGTHVETWLDNLLAETSIRYGKAGGIAYHHVSDLYVALFTHFIPCGVWEAVYIIEGLLRNASEVQPKVVHADTQGQSFPIYTLAHLMGFELMPRVRNWKDLIFYRPAAETVYTHIDALFGEPGRNVIDWDLIETHFRDLMRVAISIREGKVSSATLMRRLSSNSRRNHVYQAFREVGRVIRTVQLLRFLSDAPLRRRVTAATNKVESYNGFAQWLQFGKRGVLGDNDPDEQEKLMKFNQLLANCVIFHNTLDMMDVIRQLQAEGHTIEAADLAEIAPYTTGHLKRFGEYSTDELDLTPGDFDPHLDVDFDVLRDQETAAVA